MIGVMSGAINMAPMTTAVESWRMARLAMVTDNASMVT